MEVVGVGEVVGEEEKEVVVIGEIEGMIGETKEMKEEGIGGMIGEMEGTNGGMKEKKEGGMIVGKKGKTIEEGMIGGVKEKEGEVKGKMTRAMAEAKEEKTDKMKTEETLDSTIVMAIDVRKETIGAEETTTTEEEKTKDGEKTMWILTEGETTMADVETRDGEIAGTEDTNPMTDGRNVTKISMTR